MDFGVEVQRLIFAAMPYEVSLMRDSSYQISAIEKLLARKHTVTFKFFATDNSVMW